MVFCFILTRCFTCYTYLFISRYCFYCYFVIFSNCSRYFLSKYFFIILIYIFYYYISFILWCDCDILVLKFPLFHDDNVTVRHQPPDFLNTLPIYATQTYASHCFMNNCFITFQIMIYAQANYKISQCLLEEYNDLQISMAVCKGQT